MKRLLCHISAAFSAALLAMTVCVLPQPVSADESGDYRVYPADGMTYHLYDDHAELAACNSMWALFVTLPDSVGGKPLTVIGDNAFSGHQELGGVVLPDTVTSIRSYAFNGCTALKSVEIPDSVTYLDGSAFWNTPWLQELHEANPLVIINDILISAHECGDRKSTHLNSSHHLTSRMPSSLDRKSTRLNSSHHLTSRMPSSA